MRQRTALVAVLFTFGLTLSACGDDDTSGETPAIEASARQVVGVYMDEHQRGRLSADGNQLLKRLATSDVFLGFTRSYVKLEPPREDVCKVQSIDVDRAAGSEIASVRAAVFCGKKISLDWTFAKVPPKGWIVIDTNPNAP